MRRKEHVLVPLLASGFIFHDLAVLLAAFGQGFSIYKGLYRFYRIALVPSGPLSIGHELQLPSFPIEVCQIVTPFSRLRKVLDFGRGFVR